jgi:putative membrane protein
LANTGFLKLENRQCGRAASLKQVSIVLIALVALEHISFMILEMAFWDHRVGRKIFAMTEEVSRSSKTLAANQGLYNGFLVAGLVWALAADRLDLKVFFLGCVIVAGIFGAATAKRSILFTQALPGALALGTVLVAA